MRRSAKPREPQPRDSLLRIGAAGLIGAVIRNPVLVGGSTAFLVALSFVSANALWYQPYAHSGAFFATREFADPNWPASVSETTIRIERPEPAVRIKSDPKIEQIQAILRDLNFYAGDVDGLAGPNTRKAIEAYQAKVGLSVTGIVDAELLEQLGAPSTTAGIVPVPVPRNAVVEVSAERFASTDTPGSDQRIVKIQAGLKAFGNDNIEIDGVIGSHTKEAIREFQGLFGLPETGEPDQAVYAKMKEIGLTN
jgi:peptidoglycan hydrolase-like protein with peptidoglycan-binding domain